VGVSQIAFTTQFLILQDLLS